MCQTLTSSLCVVSSVTHVVPGSIIDCEDRDVEVRAKLAVHDAKFDLYSRSVLVTNSGSIEADCPDHTGELGFGLYVSSTISVPDGGAGKLTARCDQGGGRIVLAAGGDILLGANGADVSGTAQDAPAGALHVSTAGNVTTTAEIKATTTGGVAAGGSVAIDASVVTIGKAVTATASGAGESADGGTIVVVARDDLTIGTGSFDLDASTELGTGGVIRLSAGKTLRVNRPLRSRGVGASTTGGSVHLDGQRVEVENSIIATGGLAGGQIIIGSTREPIVLGANASANFELDVRATSTGAGGSISGTSTGNDVDVRSAARLLADGGGSGPGGAVSLVAAGIVTAAGSQITADGPSGGGGRITTRARGASTYSGTVRATNGAIEFGYLDVPPSVGAGVAAPFSTLDLPHLKPPCGDDVQRLGSEACDGNDLAGEGCVSRGFAGGGSLSCTAACQFDVNGCVP